MDTLLDKKKSDPFEFTDTYQSDVSCIVRPHKKSEDSTPKVQKVRPSYKQKEDPAESEAPAKMPDSCKDGPVKKQEDAIGITNQTSKKSNDTKSTAHANESGHVQSTAKEAETASLLKKNEVEEKSKQTVDSGQEVSEKEQPDPLKSDPPRVVEKEKEPVGNPDLNQTLDSSMSQEEEEFENMGYVSGDDTTNYADEAYPQNNDPTLAKSLKHLDENPDKSTKKQEEVNYLLQFLSDFLIEKMSEKGTVICNLFPGTTARASRVAKRLGGLGDGCGSGVLFLGPSDRRGRRPSRCPRNDVEPQPRGSAGRSHESLPNVRPEASRADAHLRLGSSLGRDDRSRPRGPNRNGHEQAVLCHGGRLESSPPAATNSHGPHELELGSLPGGLHSRLRDKLSTFNARGLRSGRPVLGPTSKHGHGVAQLDLQHRRFFDAAVCLAPASSNATPATAAATATTTAAAATASTDTSNSVYRSHWAASASASRSYGLLCLHSRVSPSSPHSSLSVSGRGGCGQCPPAAARLAAHVGGAVSPPIPQHTQRVAPQPAQHDVAASSA